jgi:hypothetical protein
MPKFTVLVAHDVPHYGTIEIEAANADQALAKIREMYLGDILAGACFDPAFDASICARIVHMQDEAGNTAHEDTPLDHGYAEWCVIGDLTSLLRQAEDYLSGFDTRMTPAMLARRIRTALGKAEEA